MIMNMTTDYRDPLLDLFGTESNSGNETSSPSDIPVINRSGTFNQQQFSPLLTQQLLYNTPNSGSTPNIFDPNHTQMQEEQTSPSLNKLQPEDPQERKGTLEVRQRYTNNWKEMNTTQMITKI